MTAATKTGRSILADALNRALGLELADFGEARVFLRSREGSGLLDAWLKSRPDDDDGDEGEPAA